MWAGSLKTVSQSKYAVIKGSLSHSHRHSMQYCMTLSQMHMHAVCRSAWQESGVCDDQRVDITFKL